MLNLFKSQVQSSNQIKLSQSQHLWNDLSLDESSSYVGGKLIWRHKDPVWGLVGWCRKRLDGTVSCTYREPGVD
ncbi:hypothetical protein QUA82_22815 [Microcoleus sp. F8-D3]